MNRSTDKETDTRLIRSADKEIDRRLNRSADKETDRRLNRSADKDTDRRLNRSADKDTDRRLNRSTDKDTDRRLIRSADKEIDRRLNRSADKEIDRRLNRSADKDKQTDEIDFHVYQEEHCPRIREKLATEGRRCLRKCRPHADCKNPRKQCLCDDVCGWSCVRPDLTCDLLGDIENGKIQRPHVEGFGVKVIYSCNEGFVMSGPRERRCQGDGSWSDRAPVCIKKENEEDENNKQGCTFKNTEPHLVAFQGDKELTDEISEISPGSELIFRCSDVGKFRLIGSVRRKCLHGDWTGMTPSCHGLSQKNDYALEKPPTILFRHHVGPIAQSNDGKLVVYPGTVLHLECLWIRKYGTPKWEVSHSYRKYPEGWTNEPGRDPQLEYRLSIYNAQKNDSGQFTCITPMGQRHHVDIVIK
ncbi:uncharacterized protein LOC111083286, partial [Limulus polyphemus]|uniref:Uncharacterized protein LOC111083286 n=1 Tax=Limulus polyphemus TaxID=6850 RepID=A0ABM1RVJ6_LIMPO